MARRTAAVLVILTTVFAPARRAIAQAATTPAGTPQAAGTDPLLGLWGGGEAILGPQVRGEILVERSAHGWNMRVAGFESSGAMAGDSLVLALSGGQGTLRAWLHGEMLEGYWIQPGGFDGPSYSTPVKFQRARSGAWRGTVTPLDSRFPLYLSIARKSDGTLRGVFRNPEANWPGRAGVMPIQRDADTIVLINPRTGKPQYRQTYDSANGTIMFDFGAPLVLTRRRDADAIGYFPRSTALSPYIYRAPLPRLDGWRTGTAQAMKMDAAALQLIIRGLAQADPIGDSLPRVHSLLVARHGVLVLDEYFYGYSEDRLHDLRSASKTMTSIMAGAAMYHGATFSMSSPIDTAAALKGITIGHLLTHSSGLECDDDNDDSPGNEDKMQSQTSTDWYRYTLALTRVHPPGTVYAYCSAGINLVGRTISAATQQWLPAFFDRAIARPLQITNYAVNLMPSGEAYSAGGMRLRPRDFLKFGQLYLNGGIWNRTRIVSAAWVKESTARQIERPDGSTDGFGWHRHLLRAGAREFQTYEASGNGGQFVIVIPALDLVIAATAGNYGQYDIWQKIRTQLVPAVMRAAH